MKFIGGGFLDKEERLTGIGGKLIPPRGLLESEGILAATLSRDLIRKFPRLGIIGGGRDAGGGGVKPGRKRGVDWFFTDRGMEDESLDAASLLRVIDLAESSVDSLSDLTAVLADTSEDLKDVSTAEVSGLLSCFQSRIIFGIQEAIG